MTDPLQELVLGWKGFLRTRASDGSLSQVAQDTFGLKGEQKLLEQLFTDLSRGNFNGLPPIELLDAEAMTGAAGAYAASIGTIYLNKGWLSGASEKEVYAVLTEELGHHLGALLQASDAPGDEGELFSKLLLGKNLIAQERRLISEDDDQTQILVGGQWMSAEASALSGTASDVIAWLAGVSGYTGDIGITDEDGTSITAPELATIGSKTTGAVTVSNAVAITGDHDQKSPLPW